MTTYSANLPASIRQSAFSHALEHAQRVFGFQDAVACTARMLWTVLVWAATRTRSLAHAVQRNYPDTQDQTFWNRLRSHLPKQVPALERRLNELLRLPELMPRLRGRRLTLAIDYHEIPYYGAPKKVTVNCDATSRVKARRSSMSMPQCVW